MIDEQRARELAERGEVFGITIAALGRQEGNFVCEMAALIRGLLEERNALQSENERLRAALESTTADERRNDYIDIVFDGPPGPTAGRFVEVEDRHGRSIRVGEWVEDGDYWRLRIEERRPERETATCEETPPTGMRLRAALREIAELEVLGIGGWSNSHRIAVERMQRIARAALENSDGVAQMREHLECNGNPDATDEDAYEALVDECGVGRDGYCMLAGTEYCDFECPWRDGEHPCLDEGGDPLHDEAEES